MTPSEGKAQQGATRVADAARRQAPTALLGALRRLHEVRFVGLAAEIAFFVAAGLAPFAVSVLALAGLLSPLLGDAISRFEGSVATFLILQLEPASERVVIGAFRRLIGGSPSLVLAPLVVATLLAARGFTGATRGLGRLYGSEHARPVWRDALATLAFTATAVLIGALAGATAILLSPGGGGVVTVLGWARWIVIPAVLAAFLAALYRHAQGHGASWRAQVAGALVATAGMVGVALPYAATLRLGPSLGMGPVLGPVIGVVIATFSFVFGLAVALLLGGAINAEHASREGSGAARDEEPGEALQR